MPTILQLDRPSTGAASAAFRSFSEASVSPTGRPSSLLRHRRHRVSARRRRPTAATTSDAAEPSIL